VRHATFFFQGVTVQSLDVLAGTLAEHNARLSTFTLVAVFVATCFGFGREMERGTARAPVVASRYVRFRRVLRWTLTKAATNVFNGIRHAVLSLLVRRLSADVRRVEPPVSVLCPTESKAVAAQKQKMKNRPNPFLNLLDNFGRLC
jgi:hypothetical protein